MARNAVRARSQELEEATFAVFARRVGWVMLAGIGAFLLISLASFDDADWPSHTVAVHNAPTRNLCGPTGAMIAYWSYHVLGMGVWIVLVWIVALLVAQAMDRRVTHPIVRAVGVGFMTIAISGMHALFAPASGPLVGSDAGLVAVTLVGELSTRFSTVGTSLILIAALVIGTIVTADWVVLAIPRWTARGVRSLRAVDLRWLGALRLRPDADLADIESAKPSRRGRSAAGDVPIDPDAGGIGATESFDPEVHAIKTAGAIDAESDAAARPKLDRKELREKLARLPVRMSSEKRAVARDEDIPRQESFKDYKFPTLELLEDPESNYSTKIEAYVRKQAQKVEEALDVYHIDGEVMGIESGPVVTLYSVQLAPGTKVAKVQAVASDIARSLRAQNIRIVPNMVGKTTVGIEVPNLYKERVRLKELMSSGQAEGMDLPMFLGKDASGEPLVADLAGMPHMLIAGTTGSGKSVCINTIIMSWLYTKRPDELKLILIDPKMVELSQFQDIPHLMCPVVTETGRAASILEWAIEKMEERYELFKEAGVRNIAAYNELSEEELFDRFEPSNEVEEAKIPLHLPYIVFVVDELADLIMTHTDVEQSIVRIAQKARAVGMHLILATQRPQANVVTGLIKSNMPSRVSFKVASGMDSRIVLDQKGAELLLGQGDMLFLTPHSSELRRAQGTLVTDHEIRRVGKWLREVARPTFEPMLLQLRPGGEEGETVKPTERDPLFDSAVRIMIESGRGSVSLLQRRLAIGYTRASRLVDQMSLAGILGDHKGSVAREVSITLEEWEQMREMEEAAAASGTILDHDGATVDDDLKFADPDGEDEELEDEVADEESELDDEEEVDDKADDDEDEYEYEYVDEDEEDDEDVDEQDDEYADEEEEKEEQEETPIIQTVKTRGAKRA